MCLFICLLYEDKERRENLIFWEKKFFESGKCFGKKKRIDFDEADGKIKHR